MLWLVKVKYSELNGQRVLGITCNSGSRQ